MATRRSILLLLLLAFALAGCLGGEESGLEPAGASDPGERNPWQAGLADTYPTPDVAIERSAEERRANLAPPGDPEFAAFDAQMEAWMASHDITAGQVAIMKDGELRYTNGYGYADRDGTEPVDETTMFRIASVTKPMTAALVHLQVEQGLYNGTDPVFCVPPDPQPNCRLPIEPHPEQSVEDERLEDVEVRQLLDHVGGWDRSSDWVLYSPGPLEVAETLGIESPPPAWRTAQFLMGEPLDHDPGGFNKDDYCNLCYMLAGLVAEAATGAELAALYEAYLFEPLEVEGEIEPGYTLPGMRNGREPFYPCEGGMVRSVFDPNWTVCWPDGASSQQTRMAIGGLVSTASAVAAVYEVYGHHGATYASAGPFEWTGHIGGIPGSAAISGVIEDEGTASGKAQYVALFNSMEPITVYGLEYTLAPFTATWGTTEDALAG